MSFDLTKFSNVDNIANVSVKTVENTLYLKKIMKLKKPRYVFYYKEHNFFPIDYLSKVYKNEVITLIVDFARTNEEIIIKHYDSVRKFTTQVYQELLELTDNYYDLYEEIECSKKNNNPKKTLFLNALDMCIDVLNEIEYRIMGAGYYTYIDNQNFNEYQEKSIQKFHQKDRLCPIYNNNKENPLLIVNNKKLKVAHAITYLSIIKYKDTGTLVITFINSKLNHAIGKRTAFYSKDSPLIQIKLSKLDHHIKTNKPLASLTVNSKLCMKALQIENVLEPLMAITKYGINNPKEHPHYQLIAEIIFEYFFLEKLSREQICGLKIHEWTSAYRILRNPHVLQLPWSYQNLLPFYSYSEYNSGLIDFDHKYMVKIRKRVNYHLRNGNTHKATASLYGNTKLPKSIYKMVINSPIFTLNEQGCVNLKDAINKYNIDELRVFIANDDQGTIDKNVTNKSVFFKMLALGFPIKQVGKFKKDYIYLEDIIRMKSRVSRTKLEGFELPKTRNVRDYHDQISNTFNQVVAMESALNLISSDIKKRKYEEALQSLDTSQDMPSISIGNYLFRSPFFTKELITINNKMDNCVALYQDAFLFKYKNIVVMVDKTKPEEYLACIEIDGDGCVIQAKMSGKMQKGVKANPEYNEAVVKWMKKLGLVPLTDDIETKGRFENRHTSNDGYDQNEKLLNEYKTKMKSLYEQRQEINPFPDDVYNITDGF